MIVARSAGAVALPTGTPVRAIAPLSAAVPPIAGLAITGLAITGAAVTALTLALAPVTGLSVPFPAVPGCTTARTRRAATVFAAPSAVTSPITAG